MAGKGARCINVLSELFSPWGRKGGVRAVAEGATWGPQPWWSWPRTEVPNDFSSAPESDQTKKLNAPAIDDEVELEPKPSCERSWVSVE